MGDVLNEKQRSRSPIVAEAVLDQKQQTPTAAENHVKIKKQHMESDGDCEGKRRSLEGNYDAGVEMKNVHDDIRVIKTVLLGFADKSDIDVKKSLRFDETKMWKGVVKGMEGPLNETVQKILDGILEESVTPVLRELKSAVSRMELKAPNSSCEDTTPNIRDVINEAVRQEFKRVERPAITHIKLTDGWMDYLSEDCSSPNRNIPEMNLAPISMDEDDLDTEESSDDFTIASLQQELAESRKLVETLQTALRGKDETIKGLQDATRK